MAILHKAEALGRLLKWFVELSEFEIVYHLRSVIKGQLLTDFIAELSDVSKVSLLEPFWKLKIDGSSKVVGGGVGMVLRSPGPTI